MITINEKNNIVLGEPKILNRSRCGYGVWLDTETCNNDKMIFDFSIKLVNLKNGSIKEEHSFVIEDTYKTKKIIMGQYSKLKRKQYKTLLKSGYYKMITRKELVDFLNNLFDTYKISCVCAFNIEFDIQALYNTLTYTNSRMKYFKEPIINELSEVKFFECDMLDLWAYASIIFASNDYKKWYISKDYKMTKKGFLKTGVEMLTRYLKENGKFVEAHRGQEDLDNEYNIFVSSALLRNDKKLLVNVSGLKALSLAKPNKINRKSKQYAMFIKQILEN